MALRKVQTPCSTADPEIFFPPNAAQNREGIGAADLYCGGCPFKFPCLWAAYRGGEAGTWGGLTEKQRLTLRRYLDAEDLESPYALRWALKHKYPACPKCQQHKPQHQDGLCWHCFYARRRELRAAEAAACTAELSA